MKCLEYDVKIHGNNSTESVHNFLEQVLIRKTAVVLSYTLNGRRCLNILSSPSLEGGGGAGGAAARATALPLLLLGFIF